MILNTNKSFSYKTLFEFIKEIDFEFPVPLSKKVNLEEFTLKIYDKAYICSEIVEGKILCAVIGYVDNLVDNMSYLSLIGTLPQGRRQGLARKLIGEYIENCKELNVKGIHLYTDKSNIPAINLYRSLGFIDYKIENEPRPNDCHLVYWINKEKGI